MIFSLYSVTNEIFFEPVPSALVKFHWLNCKKEHKLANTSV